jgi:hypothetical protein
LIVFIQLEMPLSCPSLSRVWYSLYMADIEAVDCDQCLQPTWADALYDGLCSTCSQNDLSGFFE